MVPFPLSLNLFFLPRAMFNNSSPYTAKTTAGGGGGVGDASFPPQSPFASGGGQHQQGQQHQFGSTGNPFENQRARTTPTTTPFGNETSRNNEAPTPFGGRGVGGGSSSLFTSSPAPNANTSTFVGNKDDVSPPPVGNVFQRNPSGVNLGYYEPTARAFANDGQMQIPSPQKQGQGGGHLREHVAPKFSSMLFSSTQRGAGLNPQKLDSPSGGGGGGASGKDDLFAADIRRKEMAEREVNFGNVNAKGMPLFTRDAGKGGTVGRGGRRTSIGSRATTEERMNNEERSKGGASATTASLGTAYATRNAEVDANDPAAVEAAMASVQTPCWVTVYGFTNDDATFVLSKLQKIGDVVNFGQFLPPNDDDDDFLDEDYDDAFKARRKLEESPSRKKSPFSRNTDGNANGFSPRKYHGSPQYTRKFGSHSAIGSANWLHVKFQKPEFAKRALQLNGTRISDRIMIGVKPLSEKDARYIGGVCDDVDDFGSNKRNSIDRSPRGGGNKRTMLNGSASVALQPRRGTWNKVVEFVFGA